MTKFSSTNTSNKLTFFVVRKNMLIIKKSEHVEHWQLRPKTEFAPHLQLTVKGSYYLATDTHLDSNNYRGFPLYEICLSTFSYFHLYDVWCWNPKILHVLGIVSVLLLSSSDCCSLLNPDSRWTHSFIP